MKSTATGVINRHEGYSKSELLATLGKIMASIGETSGIIVKSSTDNTENRIKYASAHDLRRGAAKRLVNAGVSETTLQLLMRHKDTETTRKFYGATIEAQVAASELHEKLDRDRRDNELVGTKASDADFNPTEVAKLKSLLKMVSDD